MCPLVFCSIHFLRCLPSRLSDSCPSVPHRALAPFSPYATPFPSKAVQILQESVSRRTLQKFPSCRSTLLLRVSLCCVRGFIYVSISIPSHYMHRTASFHFDSHTFRLYQQRFIRSKLSRQDRQNRPKHPLRKIHPITSIPQWVSPIGVPCFLVPFWFFMIVYLFWCLLPDRSDCFPYYR